MQSGLADLGWVFLVFVSFINVYIEFELFPIAAVCSRVLLGKQFLTHACEALRGPRTMSDLGMASACIGWAIVSMSLLVNMFSEVARWESAVPQDPDNRQMKRSREMRAGAE
jgi:hypothetical protein